MMNRFLLLAASTSFVGLGLAAGCSDRSPGGSGTTSPNSGRIVANDDAVRTIAEAACNREERCNHVGEAKTYADRDACLAVQANEFRQSLNDTKCPSQVDGADLDECVAAIRADNCGNPFDDAERIVECRTADLCVN